MNYDYQNFDKEYQKLMAQGYEGWGGEVLEKRVSGFSQTYDQLKDLDFLCGDDHVLELGCGTGSISEFFLKDGMQLTGVDISDCAVSSARILRKKYVDAGKANFFTDNVCELSNIPKVEYDIVLDSACLHCITGSDRELVYSQIRSHLKTNGLLIVSCMIGDPKMPGNFTFDNETRQQIKDDGTRRYMPTFNMLLDELEENNFRLEWFKIKENPWWDHFTGVCRLP